MRTYDDDPKGKKKKKLFESSGSPSKAQSRAQGPAIAAAVTLGTGLAAVLSDKQRRKKVGKAIGKVVKAPAKLVKNIKAKSAENKAKKAAAPVTFKRRAGSKVPKK
jgi:hypothetical protein